MCKLPILLTFTLCRESEVIVQAKTMPKFFLLNRALEAQEVHGQRGAALAATEGGALHPQGQLGTNHMNNA